MPSANGRANELCLGMRRKLSIRFWLKVLAAAVLAAALILYFGVLLPVRGGLRVKNPGTRLPITPPWALECWLWEDDRNTAAAVQELLEGYAEHDIPVRTVLIDSPWSTRYNDFQVDTARYPEPAKFFKDLQDRGYHVVLWMTCNVNSPNQDTPVRDSSDWFNQAAEQGYLAGGDFQYRWWKGRGGFIDYSNPEAMKWWRSLQQQVLDWGVDGWKLDGTDTFFSSRLGPVPLPWQQTHAGRMTMRTYMSHYHRDEFQHGLIRNPEFITLARAKDSPLPWVHPEGYAPLDAAPVTWVGDNNHTWDDAGLGLERAIRMILESAKLGYGVIGSDVGGYHGSAEIPARLYIRWAQFSTFCGLFLNGGHGERRLWRRTPQELEIIRSYAWLHTELAPYLYACVVSGHHDGVPLMRPLKARYQYLLGDWLLVAPIYEDSLQREVSLPEGRWRYWFDDATVIEGPATFTREFPLSEYPVYVRDGAIIPMRIARPYTGLGERDWADFLTLNLYPHGGSQLVVYPTDASKPMTVRVEAGTELRVTVEGVHTPHILRVLAERKPQRVVLDGRTLVEGSDWTYLAQKHRLLVRTTTYDAGAYRVSW